MVPPPTTGHFRDDPVVEVLKEALRQSATRIDALTRERDALRHRLRELERVDEKREPHA